MWIVVFVQTHWIIVSKELKIIGVLRLSNERESKLKNWEQFRHLLVTSMNSFKIDNVSSELALITHGG